MLRPERGGKHERDLALAEDVTGLVPRFGFQAGVGDDVEAEGIAVEIGRLPGVADKKADMIDPSQGYIGLVHGVARVSWRTGMPKRGPAPPLAPQERERRRDEEPVLHAGRIVVGLNDVVGHEWPARHLGREE